MQKCRFGCTVFYTCW